jgi:hypothetical protein
MVMQYLNYEDVELREGPSSLPNTGIEDTKSEDIETAAAARIIQQRIEQCGFDADRFLRAADAFCKRPWWSRMWVVQEFHLPKREPRWYCGRLTTSTAKMSDRLEKLINHLINEAPPMIGNPEVFNDKTIIARILNNIFHLILPLNAPQVLLLTRPCRRLPILNHPRSLTYSHQTSSRCVRWMVLNPPINSDRIRYKLSSFLYTLSTIRVDLFVAPVRRVTR